MTWFKVDDGSAFNAKVMAAGNEAWGAFCRVGAWCSQQLTDGAFSRAIALTIAPMRVWDRLAAVGLVDRLDGGEMQMHDYLQRNPSKAQILANRDATKRRVNAHRNGVTSGVTNEVTALNVLDGSGSGEDLESLPVSSGVVLHTARIPAESIWAELWSAKYKRPHVWDGNTGPKGATAQLIGVWKRAEAIGDPESIFRHWVKGYLRDHDVWIENNSHSPIGLASRVNRYGFPRAERPAFVEPVKEQEGLSPQEQGERAKAFLRSKASENIGTGGKKAS